MTLTWLENLDLSFLCWSRFGTFIILESNSWDRMPSPMAFFLKCGPSYSGEYLFKDCFNVINIIGIFDDNDDDDIENLFIVCAC